MKIVSFDKRDVAGTRTKRNLACKFQQYYPIKGCKDRKEGKSDRRDTSDIRI